MTLSTQKLLTEALEVCEEILQLFEELEKRTQNTPDHEVITAILDTLVFKRLKQTIAKTKRG